MWWSLADFLSCNPVYVRHVDSSTLAFSLSSHRLIHKFCLKFSLSRFIINNKTFFCMTMGTQIPVIDEKEPIVTCGCRKFQLDDLGDHLCTCTTHSDSLERGDHVKMTGQARAGMGNRI